MTTKKQIALAVKTTLISFIVGTIIFGLYFFTSHYLFLFLGIAYIILAVGINLVVLILTLGHAKHDFKNRKKLFKASGLLFLNIPVVIAYIWFFSILSNTLRITFTNVTDNKITEININGCETKFIQELKPNESKTVWVKITSDCSVNINYTKNGTIKTENAVGYATNNMGKKIDYKIGK